MSADRELNTIEETAANWMVERDRGLSSARERELARWLAADSRHAAVFTALAETWSLIGESPPVELEPREHSAYPTRRRAVGLRVALAAAAAIVVAGVGAWRFAEVRTGGNTSPYAIASATEIGGLRSVALPDGSVIQLNTDSAVDV